MTDEKQTRLHPALPSISEAKNNYDCARSDHAPLLVSINEPDEKEKIKIVSWNVLQEDFFNGLSEMGKYNEDKNQKKDRHQRIADSLQLFVKKNKPDFITLQELAIKHDPKLCDFITNKIESEGYEMAENKEGDCITFFHKDWEIEREINSNDMDLGGNNIVFKNVSSQKKIKIINVHGSSSSPQSEFEKKIKSSLEQEKICSVIVGDFNHPVAPPVAPLDNKSRNIATCVSSGKYNGGRQGASAIDGGFFSYTDEKLNKKIYKTAEIQALNPETGDVYSDKDLEVNSSILTENQKKIFSNYRLTIAVDSVYETEKLIDKTLTIFEYEQRLRSQFDNQNLLVRPAKSLNNNTKIGVLLDKILYDGLQNQKNPNFTFQAYQDRVEDWWYYVFVDTDKTGELLQATNKIAKEIAIAKNPPSKTKRNLGIFLGVATAGTVATASIGLPLGFIKQSAKTHAWFDNHGLKPVIDTLSTSLLAQILVSIAVAIILAIACFGVYKLTHTSEKQVTTHRP